MSHLESRSAPHFFYRHWRFLLAAVLLLAIVLRITGASDVYERDQSRTMSYTIDMLVNGNWLLPADPDGHPATKPLLTNILQIPPVAVFGPVPWAFKLPSLIALLLTVLLLRSIARETFRHFPDMPMGFGLGQRDWALLLTLAFYVLSPMQLRLAWMSRPDMLLVLFMTLGWWAAARSLALQEGAGRWPLAFWGAIVAVAWTKGPLALPVLAYPVLSALLIQRDMSALRVFRPLIWLPVSLLLALAWPIALWFHDPDHLVTVLIGEEIGVRFGSHWYDGLLTSWQVVGYVVTRSLPFTLFLLPFLYFFPWRKWRGHPLAPMLLYCAMIIAMLAAMALRRGDQFGPLYPAIAVICAWTAVYARPDSFWLRVYAWLLPFVALGLGAYYQFFCEAARTHRGDDIVAFASEVRGIANGEPVLFCRHWTLGIPVEPLLGVNHRGNYPTEAPAAGAWVVTLHPPEGASIRAVSPPIWKFNDRSFSLYRAGANEPVCQ